MITTFQRWLPTPFLQASCAVHALAIPALLWPVARWPAILVLVANHLAIATQGLLPRSTGLGPNLNRLPASAAAQGWIALTIDDGPDPEVTPGVLDELAAAGARATFFCIGARARQHPELCRRIVAEGHCLGNHGARHPHHASLFGPAGWRTEVRQGQAILEALTGVRPRFFRAVAGLRNPFLAPVLGSEHLHLVSWSRRAYDTRCRDGDEVLRRLTESVSAGDILLLHDGHAARSGSGRAVILEVLPRLLSRLAQRGLTPVSLDQACPRN